MGAGVKRPPRPRAHAERSAQRPARTLARRRPAARTLERPVREQDAAALFGSEEPDVSVGFAERRRERVRARRRFALRRAVSAVAALAAALALAWTAFASPLFALRSDAIRVEGGDETVGAREVVEGLRAFVGTPLTRLDTRAVRASARSLPRVDDAAITRRWPNGLVVRVTPRVARLAVRDGGAYEYVDAEGVTVGRGSGAAGLIPAELSRAGRDRQAGAILDVWGALPVDLRARVARASAEDGMVSLRLDGGREVRWGVPGDTRLKASVLAVLLDKRQARVYDVSDPTKPVVS